MNKESFKPLSDQIWSEYEPVLVSVFVATYNHAKFIEDALKGFLIQETNFRVEVLINEDCSTDNTAEILKRYEKEHPDLFKVIYQTVNQYSQGIKPFFHILPKIAKGRYIAICEGDDYWTDPLKLQKQVDFLEANQDYIMCFHELDVLTKDGDLIGNFITKMPKSWEKIEDMAYYGQYIHTNTILFRNVMRNYPDVFSKYPSGDFIIEMLVAENGLIKYMDEKMSVYRFQVGIHSTLTAAIQNKTFHLWLLPLWIYFYQKGNLKIANILMYRIYTYIESIKNTDIHKEYVNYLYDGLGKDLFGEFLNGINSYFKEFSEKSKRDYHDLFMRNASILYLLKVIYYKSKQKLGFVKR